MGTAQRKSWTAFRRIFQLVLFNLLTMADDGNQASAAAAAAEEESPKKNRIFRSLSEKVGLCIEAECVVKAEKKMSFRAFCREKDVDPAQLRRWQKNIVKYKKAMEDTTRKKTKLTANMGKKSRLWI